MYRVILIDDENKPREVLSLKIKEFCPLLEIVDTASSVNEGYEKCLEHHPDIVFLDVNLSNETGFDLLNKFTSIPFEVIFATAYHQYAIEAFMVSAVGYLMKPIKSEELIKAVNVAIQHLKFKNTAQKYDTLIHNIKSVSSQYQKIVIPCVDRYEFVDINQILFCEGNDKYTNIYVKDGRKILSSFYIGKFKSMLVDHGFYITHKSYIVNLSFVKTLTSDDEITLNHADFRIPLARRRKTDFLQTLGGRL
jgi:two-component system LytT family response regulator